MLSALKKVQQPLIWWLLAASIAAALKWHFSAADSASLAWMLRPLALALQWFGGWHFERSADGDWYCPEAGIVLVKACAGINFMIMSFVAWCELLRPRSALAQAQAPWIGWPLRLATALGLAWCAAFAVNSLRVMAIVAWQPALEEWLMPATAHRFLGLIIYLSVLILQLRLDRNQPLGRAAIAGTAIYLTVMLVVPLLTGNARANSASFREHAQTVLVIALPLLAVGLLSQRMRVHWPAHRPRGSLRCCQ